MQEKGSRGLFSIRKGSFACKGNFTAEAKETSQQKPNMFISASSEGVSAEAETISQPKPEASTTEV